MKFQLAIFRRTISLDGAKYLKSGRSSTIARAFKTMIPKIIGQDARAIVSVMTGSRRDSRTDTEDYERVAKSREVVGPPTT